MFWLEAFTGAAERNTAVRPDPGWDWDRRCERVSLSLHVTWHKEDRNFFVARRNTGNGGRDGNGELFKRGARPTANSTVFFCPDRGDKSCWRDSRSVIWFKRTVSTTKPLCVGHVTSYSTLNCQKNPQLELTATTAKASVCFNSYGDEHHQLALISTSFYIYTPLFFFFFSWRFWYALGNWMIMYYSSQE